MIQAYLVTCWTTQRWNLDVTKLRRYQGRGSIAAVHLVFVLSHVIRDLEVKHCFAEGSYWTRRLDRVGVFSIRRILMDDELCWVAAPGWRRPA